VSHKKDGDTKHSVSVPQLNIEAELSCTGSARPRFCCATLLASRRSFGQRTLRCNRAAAITNKAWIRYSALSCRIGFTPSRRFLQKSTANDATAQPSQQSRGPEPATRQPLHLRLAEARGTHALVAIHARGSYVALCAVSRQNVRDVAASGKKKQRAELGSKLCWQQRHHREGRGVPVCTCVPLVSL
jgi:hypothetical protein